MAGPLLLAFVPGHAQDEELISVPPNENPQDADSVNDGDDTGDGQATVPELAEASRSDYSETVPAIIGNKSVGAELIEADQRNDVLFDVDFLGELFPRIHERKKSLNELTGIALNADYSLFTQKASFSFTDKDAASSVFRVYGNWLAHGDKHGVNGNLVFKFEHRGSIWGDQVPRDLGFNMGSALSSANYKQSGWGFTDLYWKQVFNVERDTGILIGHMDPGDWADQHALLNAWTNLINDAFYNNPTEAIPKRTFSLVGRLGLTDRWFVGGGIHDANGKDNDIDFKQVWDTPELFTWVEFGFRARDYSTFGETTHLHYWHQDKREAAGVEESWGLTFSSSKVFDNGIIGVIRAGHSEGGAAQMREFLGIATSFPMRGSDTLKFGVGWGSPPDKSLRSQTVLEILYRLHVTQNMTVSPDLQVTFNPSFNDQKDTVYVIGLRFRYSL